MWIMRVMIFLIEAMKFEATDKLNISINWCADSVWFWTRKIKASLRKSTIIRIIPIYGIFLLCLEWKKGIVFYGILFSNIQALNNSRCWYFSKLYLISWFGNLLGLSKLSIDDKEELVKCSIHSVILLSIQRKCDHYNYFNCDQYKLETFLKRMPRFSFTSYFMKTIHEKFDKFKLDEKEYGLYSALLVISTGESTSRNHFFSVKLI